ncbi:MAG: hypothetical protein Q4C33_04805 [bacterium]|nr:hypothetical protein [bacterium]
MNVINKGEVFPQDEATTIMEKVYILVVDSYKEIYLRLNYGTYEFVKGDKSILDELEPFVLVNNYVLDHPFIAEKMIYKSYYVIDSNKNAYDLTKLEKIAMVDLKQILEENKYNNPRNNAITEEMLEIVDLL